MNKGERGATLCHLRGWVRPSDHRAADHRRGAGGGPQLPRHRPTVCRGPRLLRLHVRACVVQAHHAGHGAQADLYAVLDDVFKALPFDYEQSKEPTTTMACSVLSLLMDSLLIKRILQHFWFVITKSKGVFRQPIQVSPGSGVLTRTRPPARTGSTPCPRGRSRSPTSPW